MLTTNNTDEFMLHKS